MKCCCCACASPSRAMFNALSRVVLINLCLPLSLSRSVWPFIKATSSISTSRIAQHNLKQFMENGMSSAVSALPVSIRRQNSDEWEKTPHERQDLGDAALGHTRAPSWYVCVLPSACPARHREVPLQCQGCGISQPDARSIPRDQRCVRRANGREQLIRSASNYRERKHMQGPDALMRRSSGNSCCALRTSARAPSRSNACTNAKSARSVTTKAATPLLERTESQTSKCILASRHACASSHPCDVTPSAENHDGPHLQAASESEATNCGTMTR